tara:strand:+ start:337 stop:564 length:228 start_codon:yes stop_codon:yes gene_type:complete
MPKGQAPTKRENINQEYDRLMKDLKNTPKDYDVFQRIKRKARSLLKLEDTNPVVSKKRNLLEKRIGLLEKKMLRK